MFRVAILFFLALSASTAHAATAIVATSSPEAFRGTVSTVSRCYSGGSLITLTDGRKVLNIDGPVFPLGATVEPGLTLYALVRATTTCDIDPGTGVQLVEAKLALALAVGVMGGGQSGGGSGGGAGSGSQGGKNGSNPIQNQFSQILSSASSKLQSLLSGGGASAPAGMPFGGPITEYKLCKNGAIYTFLGPPTPGPYIWMPGTVSYAYGPPAFVGQYLLGLAGPFGSGVCVIGTTAIPGYRIIMHGSSGPVTPAPPSGGAPSKAGPSCASPSGAPNTPAGKKLAEDAVRRELDACKIKVFSSKTNGAACAFGQNGLDAGCTDVGGLQCSAIKGACALREKCAFTITGGTELGHKFHDDGNALDVDMGIWQCVQNNFERIDNCHYRDPATGTTFLNEQLCPVKGSGTYKGTTGAHVHICINGRGC